MLRSGQGLSTVANTAELSPEAIRFVRPGRAPRDYFEILMRNRLYDDAIALLAHILPIREAVWWAWSCARDAAGEKAAPPVEAVLEATRVWILEPTDANRRAANDAADAMDYEGAACMAALAVFLCGDTLGPADAAPAPPGPFAAAGAVAGAVILAAGEGDPAQLRERYTTFIARAVERADKGNAWAPAAPAASKE